MTKKLLHERAETVKAMDTIVRCINNEDYIMPWLYNGVADGDIDDETTDEDLEIYCEDNNFRELMKLFLRLMVYAKTDGGLYSGRICSEED